MRFIKFCNKKHNLKNGSPTIQLGTFQYYREMDPEFSIADSSEGTIKYISNVPKDKPLTLTSDQLNGISASAGISYSSKGSAAPRWPSPIKYSMTNGVQTFLENGNIEWSGILEIEYTFPNAYIFCLSIFEDDEEIPDPCTIDENYDSYYEIKNKDIDNFINEIKNKLHQSLTYQDIDFTKLPAPASVSMPLQIMFITPSVKEVQYVKNREIILNTPEDFEANALVNRYAEIIFEKSEKHTHENEFRIAYFLQHPKLGALSAFKNPKILDINPIIGFIK